MIGSTDRTAAQLLDQIQRLDQLDTLDAEQLAHQLGAELDRTIAGLETCDAQLGAALAAIDGFTQKSMRIRLDHALADDTSVPALFRKTLAATVISYEHDLETMRERVAAVAARAGGNAEIATRVVDAARAALADRDRLRERVRTVAVEIARALVPAARVAEHEDPARWRPLRRDLELTIAQPARIDQRLAARLASLPPDDEPVVIEEPPSREDLIELD